MLFYSKKLMVNTVAMLSVVIGLMSYASMARADYYLSMTGNSCQDIYSVVLPTAHCRFESGSFPDYEIHDHLRGASFQGIMVTIKGTSRCWNSQTRMNIRVDTAYYPGAHWHTLGTYTLRFSLPSERSGIYYFGNPPAPPSGKFYKTLRVSIRNDSHLPPPTMTSCIESVSLFGYY